MLTRVTIYTSVIFLLLSCSKHRDDPVEYDLVISNVNVINVEDGSVSENVNIGVTDGRITSVSPRKMTGENTIEGNGAFALPGFINAHAHLFGSPRDSDINSQRQFLSFAETGIAEALPTFIERGFTTVVDPGGITPYSVETRDRINTEKLTAPRVLTVGKIIEVEDGYLTNLICQNRNWCRENHFTEIHQDTDIETAVAELYYQGVDFIKIIHDSGFRMEPGALPVLSHGDIRAIVNAADNLGLPVYAHTTELSEFISGISLGIDGFLHAPVPVDGSFIHDGVDFVQVASENNIPIISGYFFLAPSLKEPSERAQYAAELKNDYAPEIRRLMNAGLPIVFGSDYFPGVEDRLPLEIEALQAVGLSNLEIIQTLTLNAQALTFIDMKLGKIAPDYEADILLFDDNPVEHFERIFTPKVVVKSGGVFIKNPDRRFDL